MSAPQEFAPRLGSVLHVLYLLFNEGYTSSTGTELHRTDLTVEAIRLTRAVHAMLPEHGEVIGLLALMPLNDARRPARTGAHGELIPAGRAGPGADCGGCAAHRHRDVRRRGR
jgi:predicted RNA polymerase sigma factor